jgi:hypothetical protein
MLRCASSCSSASASLPPDSATTTSSGAGAEAGTCDASSARSPPVASSRRCSMAASAGAQEGGSKEEHAGEGAAQTMPLGAQRVAASCLQPRHRLPKGEAPAARTATRTCVVKAALPLELVERRDGAVQRGAQPQQRRVARVLGACKRRASPAAAGRWARRVSEQTATGVCTSKGASGAPTPRQRGSCRSPSSARRAPKPPAPLPRTHPRRCRPCTAAARGPPAAPGAARRPLTAPCAPRRRSAARFRGNATGGHVQGP